MTLKEAHSDAPEMVDSYFLADNIIDEYTKIGEFEKAEAIVQELSKWLYLYPSDDPPVSCISESSEQLAKIYQAKNRSIEQDEVIRALLRQD